MLRSFFFIASQRFLPKAWKLPCLIFAMVGLATTTQAAEQRINLPSGGYVTVDPDYDLPGATPVENAGIVRWYDQDSSLIRAVHGSTANDRVGSGGITVIGNGNFLVSSPAWDHGAVVDAGALTFSEVLLSFFGSSLHHPISATNSRVGSATGDLVVSGTATVIGTGGFVVCCPQWDNGAATDAGAVITGGVFTGYGVFSGVVSASNAMVGTSANDQVGSGGIHQPFLPLGTAPVVHSPLWDNGGVVNVGAVTFLVLPGFPDSAYGVISATNSLMGSSANDQIGSGGIIPRSSDHGPALVHSPLWDNGGAADAGAVTSLIPPGYPSATVGVVTSANSLVGSSAGDQIGSGGIVHALGEGAGVVVHSPLWDKAGAADAGAVSLYCWPFLPETFGGGTVSATNSLLGTSAGDQIGSGGVTWVKGVGFLVSSPLWDNAGTANAGAVTLMGNPSAGFSTIGMVSSTNSLVGSSAEDQVGSGGVTALGEISVYVQSPLWDNGGAANAGAVTMLTPPWFGGVSAGVLSAANSLVGSSAGDQVGSGGVSRLGETGLLVCSPVWDNGGATDAGAVTILVLPMTGPGPTHGVVSAANSLVGSSTGDQIGSGGGSVLGETALLVCSPVWDNGGAADAGAVTILVLPMVGLGTTHGVVSASNSLVGSSTGDQVGSGGVTRMDSLGALVSSPLWDNGVAADAGAVTILVSPMVGLGPDHGVVSASNSLVGSSAGDQIGSGGLTVIGEEEETAVMVCSPLWDNTGAVDAGAVTFLMPPWFGIPPSAGVVSATNSLVGTSPGDQVGSGGITLVGEHGMVISSPLWDNGSAANAGAVTLTHSPLTGLQTIGVVSATNSLVGSSAEDQVGSGGIVIAEAGGGSLSVIVVRSPLWDNGSAANAGAVTMLIPPWFGPPTFGVVSAANSVVGSSTNDQVGSGGIFVLEDGTVLVCSPLWDSGGAVNAGAVTRMPPAWFGPTYGVVSAANSWVGSSANDQVGSGGVEALGAAFVVESPEWGGGAGALTFWWPPFSPSSGVVSGANSLVGSTANDKIGSGGITPLGVDGFLVHSPLWDNGSASNAGALTLVAPPWFGGAAGVVSADNSLVGSSTNDQVGGTDVLMVEDNGVFVVQTPLWDNGGAVDAGAVTMGLPPGYGVPFRGAISAANSLVGISANDRVGSGGVTIENGSTLLVLSPLWDNGAAVNAGAMTIGTLDLSGLITKGAVSAANSLVGSSTNDQVGGGSLTRLAGGQAFVFAHPQWDNGGATDAGAVTVVRLENSTGTISASNSMVGSTANDQVGRDGLVPYAADSFVVLSPVWDNGVLVDAGAATTGRATEPFTGVVSASNSYVGSSANDQVGSGGAKVFGVASCLIHSPLWDHRTAADAGAVTWLTQPGPHLGRELNEFNSLMGSHPNDRIGSGGITVQANPLVTVHSPNWCYGAGAVTHFTSSVNSYMASGVVNAWNSIVGPENVEPEFALQRPVGNDVAENSTHAFGNVTVGGSGALTFTIRNRGLDDLRLVSHLPWIKGQDAAMFSLSVLQPPHLVVTGDSVSLTVNFRPTSTGPKTATLSIFISIDGLAPPREFSVSLTGTGEAVTLSDWRQTHFGSSANTGDGADGADFDRDGIPNLVEYALGLHPAQGTAAQLPRPVRSGGNFTLSVTQPVAVAGVVYGAEWSPSLADGSWLPVTDTGTAPQHVFSVPIGSNKRMYMRLKIMPSP